MLSPRPFRMSRSSSDADNSDDESSLSSHSPSAVTQQPKAQRPPRLPSPAPPGSINAIFRDLSSAGYAYPICWKEEHIRLLGCKFETFNESQPSVDESLTPTIASLTNRSPTLDSWTCQKHPHWSYMLKQNPGLEPREPISVFEGAILALSEIDRRYPAFDPDRMIDLLRGYALSPADFEYEPVLRVSFFRVYNYKLASAKCPQLAYLDLLAIRELREKHTKDHKRFEPRDPYKDPYIVAILVALAQHQRRFLGDGPSGSREFPVHVLACDSYHPGFHLYKAHIPTSFLDRFDKPERNLAFSPLWIKHKYVLRRGDFHVLKDLERLLGLPLYIEHRSRIQARINKMMWDEADNYKS
ncbi:hypothetical protein F66182_4581 [Fusarium sp. NRRL 66182]|nr:hypothetical protein F66182_4581 [Fusarium sp. NRRL 66182]